MNIIHVTQTLDPAAGGPPAVVSRLGAAQAALGHDVSVVAYSGGGDAKSLAGALTPIPGIGKLQTVDLGAEAAGDRLFGKRVYRAMDEMLNRGAVVHLHGIWDPILRAGARAAKRAGARYVISPHGMLDRWSLRQKYWKKRMALVLGYRKMLDEAAFIHYLNREERELSATLALKAPNEIVPNGVFLEELSSGSGKEDVFAFLDGRPYVLFLGRLHYKKGLDVLAEAFDFVAKRDGRAHLVVAGPDSGAQAAFEDKLRRGGLQGRVHLVGPLYGADKCRALAGAAAFCLPSRQEGFSMAIIEAMGSGTPVVISEQCNFPEVESEGAGRVVELTADAVGRALLELLSDPVRSRQAGLRGRQLIADRYTWPRIAESFVDAYRRHEGRVSGAGDVIKM